MFNSIKRQVTSHKKLIAIIVALILVALIPLPVKSPYYLGLVIRVLINAMLAMTFLMQLRTGLISLAIAAFFGIGSYASAVLTMHLNLSFWLALPLSGVVAALFALLLAYPLLMRAGFTFVILTAIIGMLFITVIGNISFLGGYIGIPNVPVPDPINLHFLTIDFTSKVHFFYLSLFLFVVVILICKAFYSSWTGRAWSAIGLNSDLAGALGINVFRYKLLAFVLSSFILGVVGSFYVHYLRYADPDSYTIFTTIYVHVYAILGGVDFAIMGPIVGSAVMTFFPEMIRMTETVGPVFTGALLVVLILFLPHGLLSLTDKRTAVGAGVARMAIKIRSWLPSRRKAKEI